MASRIKEMRSLLRDAFGSLWLGVSVPRESNSDADRLSHLAHLPAVRSAAAAAGGDTYATNDVRACQSRNVGAYPLTHDLGVP